MSRRLKGSARGALVAAASLGLPVAMVVVLASVGTGLTLYNFLLFIPATLLIARASMMGIYLHGEYASVVSWYRTYRIARAELTSVQLMPYSGLINRNAESGIDPLWLFCRMLRLNTDARGEKEYPGTISSRKTAESLARHLRSWAGLFEPDHSQGARHVGKG